MGCFLGGVLQLAMAEERKGSPNKMNRIHEEVAGEADECCEVQLKVSG